MDVTRAQAGELLEDAHGRVAALLARLSDEQLARRGAIGGGDWSAKDLAAHLASWDEIAVRALQAWRRGERPAIEDALSDRGVDRLNAENIRRSLDATPAAVRTRFEASHRALVDAIGSLTDDDWSEPARYERDEPITLGELLGLLAAAPGRPFGHAYAHLKELEDYVGAVAT